MFAPLTDYRSPVTDHLSLAARPRSPYTPALVRPRASVSPKPFSERLIGKSDMQDREGGQAKANAAKMQPYAV